MRRTLCFIIAALLLTLLPANAQSSIVDVCPGVGIQPRGATYEPGGIILAPFDGEQMWVYDIDGNTRYPLPDTSPCSDNCHLSPDARWLSYLNPQEFAFYKMRLNGTQRTRLAFNAAEVNWWNAQTLLIWTPEYRVYLRDEADLNAEREYLPTEGVLAIQPGGRWALTTVQDAAGFRRTLTNLAPAEDETPQSIVLAPDRPYFNAAAWSPNGRYLAYVGNGSLDAETGIRGGELYLAQPQSAIPQQMTFFSSTYGAVRINGFDPGQLRWSPDGQWLAFWVIALLGSDPATNTGTATLHTLNVTTREVRRYCGFTTTAHTPNPPRLVWSPDSSQVAFAGNVPADDKGALLLALDIETGVFTELSEGVYPALGQPNVTAWGLP